MTPLPYSSLVTETSRALLNFIVEANFFMKLISLRSLLSLDQKPWTFR